jgi:L-threonylcarbamoyladenylate synthase
MAEIVSYSASTVENVAQRVKTVTQGAGLVAIPTETYYGLGVDPFNSEAVDRLIVVKGRGEGKPILVLIGSLSQLSLLVAAVPPAASILIEAFWPGPLTILFPAHPSLPSNLTAGAGNVGVRFTSCQPLCELLQCIGPLTGTSANRTGAPPAQSARAVQEDFQDEVELIIDAGPTPGGLPSTVIQAQGTPRIIRQGVIARTAIEASLRTRGFFLNV